jgi:hypothetical protein
MEPPRAVSGRFCLHGGMERYNRECKGVRTQSANRTRRKYERELQRCPSKKQLRTSWHETMDTKACKVP